MSASHRVLEESPAAIIKTTAPAIETRVGNFTGGQCNFRGTNIPVECYINDSVYQANILDNSFILTTVVSFVGFLLVPTSVYCHIFPK